MNKKWIIALIVIIIFSIITFFAYHYYCSSTNNIKIFDEYDRKADLNDNMAEKIKILVVGVEENYLNAAKLEGDKISEILNVSFSKEGNIGFEIGQEVLVYFNGVILSTWPAQINNPEKLEIVKQKSDIEIPEYILKSFYSTKNNVDINVIEITNKGISFKIEDKNDIKFEYGDTYSVDKRVRNENYTGIGYKIGEDTDHSTAGYSRYRFRILLSRTSENFKYCI